MPKHLNNAIFPRHEISYLIQIIAKILLLTFHGNLLHSYFHTNSEMPMSLHKKAGDLYNG